MYRYSQRLVVSLIFLPAIVIATDSTQAATTRTISFAPSRPSDAVTVPADFVGFGYESGFLNAYDNEFSHNLINSVAERMSAPPVIRIGGTSGDRLKFNPNQKANTTCIAGDCPDGSSATFVLGPGYFDGFKGFQNSKVSFQIPLGSSINSSNIQDYATRAYQALGADKLAAIAIGNEVGYEPTAAAYAKAAQSVEQIVTETLNLTGGAEKVFEVLDLASGQVDSQKPWTLADAFNAGLDTNTLTKFAAEHWYQASSAVSLQAQLMNHTAITSKFTNFANSLTYLRAHFPQLPYVLSETGSALGTTDAFADRFGACLWSVDFQLFAMSQGVSRVDGTGRPAAQHSLFVPIAGVPGNPGPQVRAPYYAQPFVADFVGQSGGTTGVVGMDLGSDFLTAYAAYAGGAEAGGFDNGEENITWAGQQWSYTVDDGKGHPASATTESVKVVNGTAVVGVEDSGAVIVYI